MKIQDEYSLLLTDMLPKYRLLNSLYQQITDNSKLSYEEQRYITDFYNQYENALNFDKAIVNLILTLEQDKQLIIVDHLKTEITKNIELYDRNGSLFEQIDTCKVCRNRAGTYDDYIDNQTRKTNKLWQELVKIRGSLESASWNKDEPATKRLSKEEEEVDKEYKEETKKLDELYDLKKNIEKQVAPYSRNVFKDLYELSVSLLSVIEKNFPAKGQSHLPDTSVNESLYFDMDIVSKVHKECGGIQFEEIPELDLYLLLNRQPTSAQLIIKSGEKLRVCYLIHKLYESLKREDKAEWRSYILNLLDIKESFYNSKYKESASEFASIESQEFVKKLHNIL